MESRQGRESTPPVLATEEDTRQATQERLVKKTYSVVKRLQKVSLWVTQTERGHMIMFPPSIGTCSMDQDMMEAWLLRVSLPKQSLTTNGSVLYWVDSERSMFDHLALLSYACCKPSTKTAEAGRSVL